MKINLPVLCATFLLCSCATVQKPVDPADIPVFLGVEKERTSTCVALFSYKGNLAIVNDAWGPYSGSALTIYLRGSGVVVYANNLSGRDRPVGPSRCNDGRVFLAELNPVGTVNARVLTPTIKRLFDNAFVEPQKLIDYIDVGPPYFIGEGSANAQMRLGPNVRAMRASELVKVAASISSASTASAVTVRQFNDDRTSAENVAIALEKQRTFLAALEKQRASRSVWDNRSKAKFSIGDRVCTWKGNFFGYIETVLPDRMKVNVIGKTRGDDGFFFGTAADGPYEKVESQRWMARDEVAPCSFNP